MEFCVAPPAMYSVPSMSTSSLKRGACLSSARMAFPATSSYLSSTAWSTLLEIFNKGFPMPSKLPSMLTHVRFLDQMKVLATTARSARAHSVSVWCGYVRSSCASIFQWVPRFVNALHNLPTTSKTPHKRVSNSGGLSKPLTRDFIMLSTAADVTSFQFSGQFDFCLCHSSKSRSQVSLAVEASVCRHDLLQSAFFQSFGDFFEPHLSRSRYQHTWSCEHSRICAKKVPRNLDTSRSVPCYWLAT